MGRHEIYRARELPLFQNRTFSDRDGAVNCAKGDVVLVQDAHTGLIYNEAFDPSLLNYDSDYQNEQGLSSRFSEHLDDVTRLLEKRLSGKTLIEVGCGKGLFLERLQNAGFNITGMDPAYEGENPAIRKEYFSSDSGERADGLVLRHVLEHVQNPVDFLFQLSEANGRQGLIYIEVPCFDWIADHRAWFDVFYEHVNYFRLNDFTRIFGRVLDAKRTFGGQYLSITADLSSIRRPTAEGSEPFTLPQDFVAGVEKVAAELKMKDAAQEKFAVWGGASKGVIFSLFMQRAGVSPAFVVDVNPAKQGRYLPASGLQVLAPSEAVARLPAGSRIVVMNSNYLSEISAMTDGRYSYLAVDQQ